MNGTCRMNLFFCSSNNGLLDNTSVTVIQADETFTNSLTSFVEHICAYVISAIQLYQFTEYTENIPNFSSNYLLILLPLLDNRDTDHAATLDYLLLESLL